MLWFPTPNQSCSSFCTYYAHNEYKCSLIYEKKIMPHTSHISHWHMYMYTLSCIIWYAYSAKQAASKQLKSATARKRRQNQNVEIDELASLVPLAQMSLVPSDKLSVLRLATTFLKLQSFMKESELHLMTCFAVGFRIASSPAPFPIRGRGLGTRLGSVHPSMG